MKSNSLLKDLGWTPNFKKLKSYGKDFINNEQAYNLGLRTGDMHVITSRFLDKDIPEWVRNIFPIEPNVVQVFCAAPGAIGMIHKDGLSRKSTLNIPISGYSEGTIDWFEEQEELKEFVIDCNYTQIRLNETEGKDRNRRLEIIPSIKSRITAPSILNTDTWHRVDNRNNNDYRWILSIRFKNNPSFDELCSIL